MQAAHMQRQRDSGCFWVLGGLLARHLLCASCKADPHTLSQPQRRRTVLHRRHHGRITNLARGPKAHRLNVRQQALHVWFSGSRRYNRSKLEGQGDNGRETCVACSSAGLCGKYVPSGGVVLVSAPGMSRGNSAQGSTTAVRPAGFGSNAVCKKAQGAGTLMDGGCVSCIHLLQRVCVCHTILFGNCAGGRIYLVVGSVAQDRLAACRPVCLALISWYTIQQKHQNPPAHGELGTAAAYAHIPGSPYWGAKAQPSQGSRAVCNLLEHTCMCTLTFEQ